MSRKGLTALRDRQTTAAPAPTPTPSSVIDAPANGNAPSRQGKKAVTAYFAPELHLTMRMTAMRHGVSLQDAMAEAMNDWLRKMGESPVGN